MLDIKSYFTSRAFVNQRLRRPRIWRSFAIISLVIMGLALLIMHEATLHHVKAWLFVSIESALLLVLLILYSIVKWRDALLLRFKRLLQSRSHVVLLYKNMCVYKRDDQYTTWYWQDVKKVCELDSYYIVYLHNDIIIPLAKSDFADYEDLLSLHQQVA